MNHTKVGLALLVLAAPTLAQTFGEITGEIRDSSGGIIVSAQVSVTNEATGGARRPRPTRTVSTASLRYPPGFMT